MTNDDFEKMEDLVFSAIPPGDVHFILSAWSGASYPKAISVATAKGKGRIGRPL